MSDTSTTNPQEVEDRNARRAFYAYLPPGTDLHAWALDRLVLRGTERILDVGCGSGRYFEVLRCRGHRGPVMGLDLSASMLEIARGRSQPHRTVQGDAHRLPVRSGTVDVVLLMHVLYDVACRHEVIDEVARVLRPRGRLGVYLNSESNLADLDELAVLAAEDAGVAVGSLGWNFQRFPAEVGVHLLREHFPCVLRRDARSELSFTDPEPVVSFLANAPAVAALPPRAGAALLEAAGARVASIIRTAGEFSVHVRTHCFVCSSRGVWG